MEDAYYNGKSQLLVSDTGSLTPQNKQNPSKFYWHFLYKAVLVTVLLVILPLFPSQAPEFVNQSVLTRNWELFHLLFVGIAVSYGLFSRLNLETEKENQLKIDNAQNYVSRIFQVSSVFDDDIVSPSGSDDNSKIQTWNSRYFRGEPMLVVEQESSVFDEQSSIVTKISNKPLRLPVRSLKSRVSDSDALESNKEPFLFSGSLSRSSSGSGSSSNGSFKTRNGEIGDVDPLDLEERLQENVVLPSPIPWRSRSGRMEMKEEPEVVTPPPYSLPPSAEEAEIDRDRLRSRSFRSHMSWSSRPNSTSPSPKELSPSPSLSPELGEKNVEDSVRKKTSSPPPPAPPPPRASRKSPVITSNSNPLSNGHSSENMEMKESFKDELKDLKSSRRGLRRRSDPGLDTLRSEVKSRAHTEGVSMAKSVRTFRVIEPIAEARKTREYDGELMEEKMGKRSNEPIAEARKTREYDGERMEEKMGKRSNEPIAAEARKTREYDGERMEDKTRKWSNEPIAAEARKTREYDGEGKEDKMGKRSKEVKAMFMEKTRRRAAGFEQVPISNEKSSPESSHQMPKAPLSKYPMEEKKKLSDKDSDGKAGVEADDTRGSLNKEAAASNTVTDAGVDSEVDKKADEFIAKFREQIRLQRIESIKRTSGKGSGRTSSR